MKALIYDIRTNSLYSIRVPFTWQTSLSYLLPPPSCIIGMLANALQRYKNQNHPLYYLEKIEENLRWAGSKLLSPAVVKSYITSAITNWEIELGGKSTNALGREYVFARKIRIVAIIEHTEFAEDLIIALKHSPITCGDSESLVSIENILPLKDVIPRRFEPSDKYIKTEYPVPMKFESLELISDSGDEAGRLFLVHERCKFKGDKKEFPLFTYLYPIREENGILLPSQFTIRIKKQIRGYEIADIGIVLTTE